MTPGGRNADRKGERGRESDREGRREERQREQVDPFINNHKVRQAALG